MSAPGAKAGAAALPAVCAGCPMLTTGFFAALSCDAKRLVACLMTYRRCRARLILFQEGDETGRLYALKSGLVKLVKARPDGREQIIRLVRPGDLFNLESLGDGLSPVTAEVVAEAEVCHMDAARLLGRMARSAELIAGPQRKQMPFPEAAQRAADRADAGIGSEV